MLGWQFGGGWSFDLVIFFLLEWPSLWSMPRYSMYDIFNLHLVYFYAKCGYIYHTWGVFGAQWCQRFPSASNEAGQDKVRFPSVNCALPHPVTGMTLGEWDDVESPTCNEIVLHGSVLVMCWLVIVKHVSHLRKRKHICLKHIFWIAVRGGLCSEKTKSCAISWVNP